MAQSLRTAYILPEMERSAHVLATSFQKETQGTCSGTGKGAGVVYRAAQKKERSWGQIMYAQRRLERVFGLNHVSVQVPPA